MRIFSLNKFFQNKITDKFYSNSNTTLIPEISTNGFIAGGASPTNINTVSSFDFSNEVFSAPGTNLPAVKDVANGLSAGSVGYICGGFTNTTPPFPATSTVDKINFSTGTISSTNALISNRADSFSSFGLNSGYLIAGRSAPATYYTYDNSHRYDFSIDSCILFSAGWTSTNLSLANNSASTIQNSCFSYSCGGDEISPTPTVIISTIRRFNFSTELLDNISSTLPASRNQLGGVFNNRYGYVAGGANPPTTLFSNISKLDFSNETITAITSLPANRKDISGLSGSNYGYFCGGYGPTAPTVIATVTRIDYQTETVSDPGRNLPSARAECATVTGFTFQ